MSNQSINLKDYEIVYNNGTSDAVWPLENDIVLAPGESAAIWRVLQTVLNTGVDDDNFIDYWKKQTSNADLNLVRGKNLPVPSATAWPTAENVPWSSGPRRPGRF